jgi:hypothetical protein
MPASETPTASSGFEWRTKAALFGIPLISIRFGRDHRGKTRVAKGLIAVGRFAVGGVAIGQFALGFLCVGWLSLGVVGFGQLALGILAGFGQFSTGLFAVGQFTAGVYCRGQVGWGEYLWTPGRTDMEAVAMFGTIDWLVSQDMTTILDNISNAVKLYFL